MSEGFYSEIRLFAYDAIPQGWMPCNGQELPIREHQALFSLIGTMYGGDGLSTFKLPDLRARIPIHRGYETTFGDRRPAVSSSESHPTEQQGFLALNFCICTYGIYPRRP